MKKLYLISRSRLQLVEIKNPKVKLFSAVTAVLLFSMGLVFIGTTIYRSILGTQEDIESLRRENASLRNKLSSAAALYSNINSQMDTLISLNNDLRVATNLTPLSKEELMLGTGGGSFSNLYDFLNSSENISLGKTLQVIDDAERKFEIYKQNYNEIKKALELNKEMASALPALKPVNGNIGENSGYGNRLHPILGIWKFHSGLDIQAPEGTPVVASGGGKVVFVGYNQGYGKVVEIDHGYGYKTKYAHLSQYFVLEGDDVKRGDLIGKVGSTGLSTGPHLHYEVIVNGETKDPMLFMTDAKYF